MANTITTNTGSESFPSNYAGALGLVQAIAVQELDNCLSADRLDGAFWDYPVKDGSVIESAILEMASAQNFNRSTPTFAPADPTTHALYFNNWDEKQFKVTVRRRDIEKIIANKGVGIEDVVSRILDTLTQGESAYKFTNERNLLLHAPVKDYSTILGGVPKSMKGVLYAIREMYMHVRANNSDLTSKSYVSACPDRDIMIALPDTLANLIDVKELASIFNLSKEEMFGKIVTVPVTDLTLQEQNKVVVYDRKAFGRGMRERIMGVDVIAENNTSNHYLTVDYCLFYNGLFKACSLNVAEAAETERNTIIQAATEYTISKTLTHCTSSNTATKVNKYDRYETTISADNGYTMSGATVTALTMGGTDISETAYTASTGKIVIPAVTGNIVITISAASA